MTQLHQSEQDNKGKIVGATASALYLAMWICFMLFFKFNYTTATENEGIMINFGDTEAAAPGADLQNNDELAQNTPQEQQSKASEQDHEQLTQDQEDAPAVKPKEAKKEKPKDKPKPAVEKPREVNKKALFPGKTAGSTAKSDGNSTAMGNQGAKFGTLEGSHTGTGIGDSGSGVNLSGRSLVGSLPRPDYNVKEEGRVVIEITVGSNGKVLTAAYRSKGSTTQNTKLVAAAETAARKAQFSVEVNAPVQIGTITYTFRMD